jgi:hypothetical protein
MLITLSIVGLIIWLYIGLLITSKWLWFMGYGQWPWYNWLLFYANILFWPIVFPATILVVMMILTLKR